MSTKLPKLTSLNQAVDYYGKTFIVLTLCKEDLKDRGLTQKQINALTDDQMSRIAEKLGDIITDNGYWEFLEGVLEREEFSGKPSRWVNLSNDNQSEKDICLPETANKKKKAKRKDPWVDVFNVKLSEDDICLHRTLKGAKKCQKIRGGEIVKEVADKKLAKEIEE